MYAESKGREIPCASRRRIGMLAIAVLAAMCICLLMTGTGEADAADGDTFSVTDENSVVSDYTIISESGKTAELTKVTFDSPTNEGRDHTVPIKVDYNGTEYKVTKIEAEAFLYADLTSVIIPDGTGIDTVYENTFRSSSIESVKLGSGVRYIETGAFHYCNKLTTITFGPTISNISAPLIENYHSTDDDFSYIEAKNFIVSSDNSLYASENGVIFNKEMTSLILFPSGKPYSSGNKEFGYKYNDYNVPDTVERIENDAFTSADMRDVTIGAGVKYIAPSAFANTFVQKFTVAPENTVYSSPGNVVLVNDADKTLMRCAVGNTVHDSDKLGQEKYTVPTGIVSIADYAFRNALGYNEIILPDSVKTVGAHAFDNCKEMLTINIGNVTSVGSYAFYKCGKMAITVPLTLKTIGAYAFAESGITGVNLAKDVTYSAYPFRSCGQIASFTVEEGHPFLKSVDGVVYLMQNSQMHELVFYPAGSATAEFAIPDSVQTVSPYAFAESKNLNKVTLGTWTTNISDYAFQNCSLSQVVFNERLMTIGNGAFDNAIMYDVVTLPDSVTTIGDSIFGSGMKPTVLNIGKWVTSIGEIMIGEHGKGITLNISPDNPKYEIVTGEYGEKALGIKEYTVIFKDNTAEVQRQTLAYGTLVTAPEYSEPGFKGWKDFTEGRTYVRGDVTFLAEYDNREYSITGLDDYVTVDRTAKAGEIVIINISCPAGKTLTDIRYNGTPAETLHENQQYRFVMPAQDVVLTGTVSDVMYSINADPDYFDRSHEKAKHGENVSVTFRNQIPTGQRLTVIGLPPDAVLSDDGKTYSFAMPAYDVNITFELNTQSYDIINDKPFQVSAPSSAMYNQTVTVTVNPPAGKVEDTVTVDGVQIESKGAHTYEFTMPAHDVTLSATFKPDVHNARVIYGENGTASLSHETDVVAGTIVTLIITPDENYTISSIGCTDLELTIKEKQTFFMPSHDVEIEVTFIGKSFSISSGPGVTVAGSAGFGSTVTVGIDNPGRELVDIRADGVEFTEAEKGVSYTFVMPGHAVDIIASFKAVFDSGSGVKEGDTTTFTAEDCDQAIVPFGDAGAESDNVKVSLVNGSLLMDKTALSKMTGASKSVTIAISSDSGLPPEIREELEGRKVYEVSVGDMHDFGDGKLTIALKYALGPGEDPELLTVWHFIDDGSVERLPCTYDADRAEITFRVSSLSRFAVMDNRFDVTVECNEGGTVTASPNEKVAEGTEITVNVTPREGYYVSAVSGIGGIGPDGEEALNKLLTLGGTVTFKMGDQDLKLKVTFAALEPEPPSGGDDKGGSNMGLYIGAAVAVLAVIGIAFFIMKRRA